MIARSSDTAACHRTVYESDLSVKELDGDILHLKTGKKQNQKKEKRAEEMPEEMMRQGQKKKKRTKRGGKIQRLVSQGATIGEAIYNGLHPVITDSIYELGPDILPAELVLAFYINNITGVAPARTQNHAEAIAAEIERLMRMNKLRYRRMDADQNEAIINSHHPAVGLPYHVIRLASFLCTSTCSTIASLLDDVQSAKPYKFTPDSKRHGGAIHDSEAAPFHFGIVRRRGNGTRYTKDAIQSTVGNINDPSDKERVAREAAWRLMLFLQQSVFSKLKKWVGRHGNVEGQGEIARWAKFEEAMRYGVCKAREQNSLPDDKELIHYHYLVSSVAIGYAEAVVPHLDINDGNSYSFIFQVDGPTGYTRVPQLGVDIAHRTGDIVILPTSQLVHLASPISEPVASGERRIVAVGYICRHVVNDFFRKHVGGSMYVT